MVFKVFYINAVKLANEAVSVCLCNSSLDMLFYSIKFYRGSFSTISVLTEV